MPTEEHIKGIQLLKPIVAAIPDIQNLLVEKRLDGTSLQPDFQFNIGDKRYVIEYQCTPISAEFVRRREIYRSVGVQDMWLCGTEKFKHHYSYGQWGWFYDVGIKRPPYKFPHLWEQAPTILEQQCDGYFASINYHPTSDTGLLYLRGRTIFKMLKNRCVYPSEIYTGDRGNELLCVCKHGLY